MITERDHRVLEQALYDNACDLLSDDMLREMIEGLGYRIMDDSGHFVEIADERNGDLHTIYA